VSEQLRRLLLKRVRTTSAILVDPSTGNLRLLTGADFDVESIRAHGRRDVPGR
jgi:hypothetical protein